MRYSLSYSIAAIALAGCAALEPVKPEVRTTVVEVKVPVPVPCFKEEDRPVLPKPSPIDIDNATVDQLGAALAADEEALEIYARAVDRLFVICSLKGIAP